MWRKLLVIGLVITAGVALDIMYLYTSRTAGGWGFKLKVTPDVGD